MESLKALLLVPDSSIYVNDLSESISQDELHLYVDDTTAFIIGDWTDDVVGKMNLLFAEICGWCDSNKLTLHKGKSEVISDFAEA